MAKYLKKRKILFTFLLIFNQLILSSYAFDNRKIVISETEESAFNSRYRKEFKTLISSKKQNETKLLSQESEDLEQYVEEIEKFVEETFDPNNRTNLENQEENNPKTRTNPNQIEEKFIKSDIKNKKKKFDNYFFVDF